MHLSIKGDELIAILLYPFNAPDIILNLVSVFQIFNSSSKFLSGSSIKVAKISNSLYSDSDNSKIFFAYSNSYFH